MKIGILTNPSAGRGHAVQSVISRIESCWPDHELYAIDSPAGSSFKRAVHLPAPEGGYVEKLYASVEQLVSAGAETATLYFITHDVKLSTFREQHRAEGGCRRKEDRTMKNAAPLPGAA